METEKGAEEEKFWSKHKFLNTFLVCFIGAIIGVFLARNYKSSMWQDQLSLLAIGIIVGILIGLAISRIKRDKEFQ